MYTSYTNITAYHARQSSFKIHLGLHTYLNDDFHTSRFAAEYPLAIRAGIRL